MIFVGLISFLGKLKKFRMGGLSSEEFGMPQREIIVANLLRHFCSTFQPELEPTISTETRLTIAVKISEFARKLKMTGLLDGKQREKVVDFVAYAGEVGSLGGLLKLNRPAYISTSGLSKRRRMQPTLTMQKQKNFLGNFPILIFRKTQTSPNHEMNKRLF